MGGNKPITSKAGIDKIEKELKGKRRSVRRSISFIWKKFFLKVLVLLVLLSALGSAVYVIIDRENKRADRLIEIQDSLTGNVYHNSELTSYSMCYHIVTSAMETDHPLITLALASRSEYVCSYYYKGAMGLCAVSDRFLNDLLQAKIILHYRDLYDPEINIKAAGFVWDLVWRRSEGNINNALEKYFYKDSPEEIKKITDQYWIFVYLCRRPKQEDEVK